MAAIRLSGRRACDHLELDAAVERVAEVTDVMLRQRFELKAKVLGSWIVLQR